MQGSTASKVAAEKNIDLKFTTGGGKKLEERIRNILELFDQHHLIDRYNSLPQSEQNVLMEDLEHLELDLLDLVSLTLTLTSRTITTC